MKLPLDKQAHIWMGAAISATSVAYGLPPLTGFYIAAGVGVLKEVIDPFIGGQRDLGDAIVTAIGAGVVLPLMYFDFG